MNSNHLERFSEQFSDVCKERDELKRQLASRDAEVAKAFEAGRQAERLECLKEEYARGDMK